MIEYVWLVPGFPLLGALVNGLFGRTHIRDRAHWVAVPAAGLSFLVALFVSIEVIGGRIRDADIFPWIVAGALEVPVGVLIDPLSAVMIFTVTSVGFLVHVYSAKYMHGDPGYHRYFTYLNLFLFAMLILVLANNYLLMFVGWEAVGVCSFLLIGFWYERKSASDAASKAFIVNRVGDAGFLLGLFLMWSTLGSFRFAEVFGRAAQDLAAGSAIPTLITLGLFVGAMGKSAQFPLSVWLPDAMEGPTPTSALIHAATMVTAGVYMVVRSSPLFNLAPDTLNVVAGVGAATAVFAASIGFVQQNIKQTIAYSTITQLGLMFMAAGLGAYATAIFHLFTHAFFKSLLFLGAGSVIQALHGEHDVRRMGGLAPHMRLTAYAFLVGVLATAGIFPLAGFWSQSHIFFTAFDAGRYFLWVLSLFAALLTAFYMFRLYLLTFHGRYRGDARTVHHLRKAPANIWIPLVILALFSVIAGFVGVTPEPGAFQRFLGQTSPLGGQGPGGPLRTLTVLLPLGVASVGVGLAYLSYVQWWDVRTRCATLYVILYRRYFVDEIYSAIFLNGLRRFCHRLAALDGRVIDTAVNRVAGLVVATGRVSSRIDETVINAAVDKSADFTLSWSARTSRFDRRVIDGTVDKVAEWSLGLGHVSSRVDQGLIDGAVNRIADIIQRCSATWRYLQTGVMQNYILAMAVGILLVAVAYVLHSFISFAGESVP
jgi:NADH-quinone oxidoreductase subunit L